jgi:hypothetical protein
MDFGYRLDNFFRLSQLQKNKACFKSGQKDPQITILLYQSKSVTNYVHSILPKLLFTLELEDRFLTGGPWISKVSVERVFGVRGG